MVAFFEKGKSIINIALRSAGKKYIGDGCLVCLYKSLEGDDGFMFFDAEVLNTKIL